jgi:hypothetical protein
MAYPAAVYEFSKAVQKAAAACTLHAETLMPGDRDPAARLALRNVIYIEYMMTFMTIGVREARKLHVPPTNITQLVIECVEPTVKLVTDPFSEVSGTEREKLIEQNRASVLRRAQALEEVWKSSATMEDSRRFLVLFGAVSKAVLSLLKRNEEWEKKAVRDGLVGGAIEAWKSTLFAKVLRPLAPQVQ